MFLVGLFLALAALTAFFVVSLVRFCRTPKGDPRRKRRLTLLIAASIPFGLAVTAVTVGVIFAVFLSAETLGWLGAALVIAILFATCLMLYRRTPPTAPQKKRRRVFMILTAIPAVPSALVIVFWIMLYLFSILDAMWAYAILAAVLVAFFVASLVLLLRTPKEHPRRKAYRNMLIVASVLLTIACLMWLMLGLLTMVVIANM